MPGRSRSRPREGLLSQSWSENSLNSRGPSPQQVCCMACSLSAYSSHTPVSPPPCHPSSKLWGVWLSTKCYTVSVVPCIIELRTMLPRETRLSGLEFVRSLPSDLLRCVRRHRGVPGPLLLCRLAGASTWLPGAVPSRLRGGGKSIGVGLFLAAIHIEPPVSCCLALGHPATFDGACG